MESGLSSCSIASEDTFGPAVANSCLQGFDFTLLFEESILIILPLGIAVLWALLRLNALRQSDVKVRKSIQLWLKLGTYVIYIAFQITLLALWSQASVPRTRATQGTLAFTLAAHVFFAGLSYLEHMLSVRPSTLLNVYLAVSLLLDIPRARTLFFISGLQSIPAVNLAGFFVKLVLLLAESWEKRNVLLSQWQASSTESTSGILDRSLFIWLNKTFIQGFRKVLTVDILTPIDGQLLAASDPTSLIEKWDKVDKSSEHALLWTFIAHYRWPLLAGVLPRVAYTGFTFAQPFLVQRVLDFTTEPRVSNSNNIAYGLTAAYGITYIGLGISFAAYQHKTYRLLTMVRGSLIAMIYSKTLRMRSTSFSDAEAITLMSADIDRIGFGMELVHEIYMSFIEIGIATWLLYRILGVAVAAPASWILVCLVIGLPIAEAAGNAQTPWLEAIERRLAATTKFLGSMKAVKMTGLAHQMSTTLRSLRSSEIRASRRFRILNVGVTLSSFLSSTIAPIWGFGTFELLARAHGSETLTQGIAFAALSLFELLDQPLMYIVDGLERIQTVINSFRRIQEYLQSEEHMDARLLPSVTTEVDRLPDAKSETSDIMLQKLDSLSDTASLNSRLVAAVKEVSTHYCTEEDDKPILEKLNLEIEKGKTTMIVGPVGCGKSTLLKLVLGEIPSVSGLVQTNFVTAAYCPQSPWVTMGTVQDNILGMRTWDQKWYNKVVRACGLSADFQEWPEGDQTKTGSRGSRLSGGQQMRVSFARALYSQESVLILDDVLTGLDRKTEREILDRVFGPKGLFKEVRSTVLMTTNSLNQLSYADSVIVLNEDGIVTTTGSLAEVRERDDYIQRLAVQAPLVTSRPMLELTDETLQELGPLEEEEEEEEETSGSARRTGDVKVYLYYSKIAGWVSVSVYLVCMVSFVFGVQFPTVWLQMWSNANEQAPNTNLGYWLGVYGALAAIVLIGCSATDAMFNLIIVPKVMWTMHDNLLTTTIRATTSFLTSTDSGKTTNRFSQDLELIDNDLPRTLDRTLYQFFTAIASAILVFVASGYVAAAVPATIGVIYVIQYYYLRTSRQLRLLDIEAKAPLFSNFLETIGGLASIRAHGWTAEYAEKNLKALNRSQKPYYLLWCLQRWLALVLDLLVASVAILLVGIATNVQSGQTGYLGTALYNVVSFSITLQNLVTEWTQLETALGAVNRVRSYVSTTVSEDTHDDVEDAPKDWPKDGTLIVSNVSASYQSSVEPVLQDVTFSVSSGDKVAICGRSGSGKSSLVSAILRMLDLEHGSITIDGINISKISRQDVRSRLITLPQEPFFIEGSVRENVDPLEQATDEQIRDALDVVRLGSTVEDLDEDLHEETLSHGQRQLFCLARALVRPSSILIMDEATSSVDADSQDLMQRVIRERFQDRTIVAIAHKLDTIVDFDQVVLLDKGRVVEIGKPRDLLQTVGSSFKALYESMVAEE